MVILNDLLNVPTFPRSVTCLSTMAARGHNKFVTFEEFNRYSFVIPQFHLVFQSSPADLRPGTLPLGHRVSPKQLNLHE